ncbi:MAG TPA: hypothetical protein VGG75_38010 [Trebonia sp.]|jgi:hypothetical protein
MTLQENMTLQDYRCLFRDPAVPLGPEKLELRRLVLKQAEAHPDTFNMTEWELSAGCRTTRCIAGWAQFFARGQVNQQEGSSFVETDAIRLLGLTEEEFFDVDEADDLFHLADTPAVDRLRYLARDPEGTEQ